MNKEVMKQALEALKNTSPLGFNPETDRKFYATIEALEEALNKEQGEPVCDKDLRGCWSIRCQLGKKCKNTPQQRKPLTDKQIDEIPFALFVPDQDGMSTTEGLREFARAIESAHGIKDKNT